MVLTVKIQNNMTSLCHTCAWGYAIHARGVGGGGGGGGWDTLHGIFFGPIPRLPYLGPILSFPASESSMKKIATEANKEPIF
jgi:hypothetical protein